MSHTPYPTATFDLVVDDEVKDTVTVESRGDASRMFRQRQPEYAGLGMQGRVKIVVREHNCEPAAGNMSVCVFCQERIDQTKRLFG